MELLANAYGLPDDAACMGFSPPGSQQILRAERMGLSKQTVQWTQRCSSTALNEGTCEMTLQRVAVALFSFATMICAFAASYYWFRSSRPTPEDVPTPDASISDNPELHILTVQVEIYSIRDALREASLLNKTAAKWSAWAAGLGGIAAFIGIF
jgi:hypothetical protein